MFRAFFLLKRKREMTMKQEVREKAIPARTGEQLITPEETAARLGVKVTTLATWRCTRKYSLPWVKIGKRRVMYRPSDVDAFVEDGVVCGE